MNETSLSSDVAVPVLNFGWPSLGRRLVAALFDMMLASVFLLILCIPLVVVVLVIVGLMKAGVLENSTAGFLGLFFMGFLLLACFVGFHAYYVHFEQKDGVTPGKKVMGLRVISRDGQSLTRSQAVRRELMRWYIDAPFFFITFIMMKRGPRPGDNIAGTKVIDEQAISDINSLYLHRDTYLMLLNQYRPAAIEESVARSCVKDATQLFVFKSEALVDRASWLTVARMHLGVGATDLDEDLALRFFAEFCSQSLLEGVTRETPAIVAPLVRRREWKVASARRRLVAFMIDGAFVNGFALIPVQVLSSTWMQMMKTSQNGGLALALLISSMCVTYMISFVIMWLYTGWFQRRYGGTAGKLVCNLKVFDEETGFYLGYRESALRDILGKSLLSIFTLQIIILMMVFRKDRRTGYDLMFGTRVMVSE